MKKRLKRPNLKLAILFVFIISIGGLLFLFQYSDSFSITGAAVGLNTVTEPASVTTVPSAVSNSNDVQVWQGQYYKGTEFQLGTFEFNFTVYDAVSGGVACYSNVTTLSTGNFGEWSTEQKGVGVLCNDATKNYYLEITIHNDIQNKRRLINSFNYLRRDVPDNIKNTLTITTDSAGSIGSSSLVLKNVRTGSTAVTVIRLLNDVDKFVSIAMGSSQTSIAGVTGNQASLSYSGGTIFVFSSLNAANIWRWQKTFSPSINNVSFDNLMDLTPTGSLILYHGDFSVNGNINATGNIITPQNVTASYFIGDGSQLTGIPKATSSFNSTLTDSLYLNLSGTNANQNIHIGSYTFTANTGFFSYVGSLVNRITTLFVQEIDVEKSIKIGLAVQGVCDASSQGTIMYADEQVNKREFYGCKQKDLGVYEWKKLS